MKNLPTRLAWALCFASAAASWCRPARAANVMCKSSACGEAQLASGTVTFEVDGCATAKQAVAKIAGTDGDAWGCVAEQVGANVGKFTCTVPEPLRATSRGRLGLRAECGDQVHALWATIVPAPATAQPAVAAPAPRTAAPEAAKNGQPATVSDDQQDSPGLSFLSEDLWHAALRQIGVPLRGARVGNYYNRVEDLAVLFFDADGDAYFPIPDIIDEDDDVYVVMVDSVDRLQATALSSSGCRRPPVEARVYRGTAELQDTEQDSFGAFAIRALGKCAGADSGGPQLTFRRGQHSQVQQIPINQLYHLAVGVAAAYDNTYQRDFVLNTLPGETVPRVAQVRDRIGLSSLTYISYYPFARDFRKKDFFMWQRAQIFVGLDPRAFDKHLVAGVGYELTAGLNALFGWRFVTKQKVLEEGSGLAPGTAFDGKLADLPTRERWETGFPGGVFFGVGLSSSLLARLK